MMWCENANPGPDPVSKGGEEEGGDKQDESGREKHRKLLHSQWEVHLLAAHFHIWLHPDVIV